MRRFYSEIDWWLVAVLAIAFTFAMIAAIRKGSWASISINGLAILFVGYLFSTTYYEIEKDVLRIKSGFMVNSRVPIGSITAVRKTYNPLASAALSLKRLEIKTTRGSHLISPKTEERSEFIESLLSVNPDIKAPR